MGLVDQPEGRGFYSKSSVTPLRDAQKGSNVVEFTVNYLTVTFLDIPSIW